MSKNKKTKFNLLKPTFIGVAFVLFVGSIFMAINIATGGAEISKLNENVYSLEKTNRELTQEIIKYSSVSAAEVGSTSLGFTKPEKTVYLNIDNGVAAYVR